MTKFADPITSSRLDTKTVPNLSDPTLAEIKHLVKADAATHSLMANYMVRPHYIGMQVPNNQGLAGATHAYAHIACLVPPKVSSCYLQVLATSSTGSVLVTAKTLAGSTVSTTTIDMTGDVEMTGGVPFFETYEQWYVGHLKIAQVYSTPTELGLVASPTWDPAPVHLQFESTSPGIVAFFGCLVQFIYKAV